MKTPTLLLAAALAAATLMPAAADAAQGRLVVYTSTPNKAMADLIAAFNKAEPEVTVEFFRSGTTEVMAKLDAEFAAGSPEPDLLLIADSVAMAARSFFRARTPRSTRCSPSRPRTPRSKRALARPLCPTATSATSSPTPARWRCSTAFPSAFASR